MRVARFSLDGPPPAKIRQKKAKEAATPILVRRKGGGLFGGADMDVELITRFDEGADLFVQITQRRHAARHRLYWAILKIVADNLPNPVQPEALHKAVKLMLGVSVVVSLPGGDQIVDGSIAFDSMREPEFRTFLDRFLALVGERLLPGVDVRSLEHEGRAVAGQADASSRAPMYGGAGA